MRNPFRWRPIPAFWQPAAGAPPEPVRIVLFVTGQGPGVRPVEIIGERAYARWCEGMPDTAARLLPHGKVKRVETPSYVTGWEPLAPLSWQPDGAETAHEKIGRLEAEIAALNRRIQRARQQGEIIRAAALRI